MEQISLTKKIISIPSYFDQNTDETKLGEFIFKYFQTNIPRLSVTKQFGVSGKRFNVIASNSANPKIVFSCHMDTVQPVGSTKAQLNARIKDNKLYGLGASDMKGGLAAAISALEDLQQNLPPIAIVFDYDEEYYFEGIINFLKKYKYKPELALFTEPTDLCILNGCRGITEVRFDVVGRSGHGSRPEEAVNAIQAGCELVKRLQVRLAGEISKETGTNSVNFSSILGGREKDGTIVEQANAAPDIARILLDIRISDPKINAGFVKEQLEELARDFSDLQDLSSLSDLSDVPDVPDLSSLSNLSDLSLKIANFKVNLEIKPCFTSKRDLQLVEKAVQKVTGKVLYQQQLDKTGLFEGAFVKPEWQCPCFAFGPGPRNTEFTKGEFVSINDLITTKKVYQEIITDISKIKSLSLC
jgi:acetylornithine deacetylase/succinyl-diaminopimelate desuccinylase-like protein